ncbi:MAG: SusC/RagA family TonB-linked outer membrane protein, partial [Draconibacterium sp.]
GQDGVPDQTITAEYDRVRLGQKDPKFIWGITNTLSYKDFSFSVFMHGVHGVTKRNSLLAEDTGDQVRFNAVKRTWWTPENETNEWYSNIPDANKQNGQTAAKYENAGFVRIKDVTFAYDLPTSFLSRLGIERFRVYMTGRNLFTFTKFNGLDPELSGQEAVPMQKEYMIGLNFDF